MIYWSSNVPWIIDRVSLDFQLLAAISSNISLLVNVPSRILRFFATTRFVILAAIQAYNVTILPDRHDYLISFQTLVDIRIKLVGDSLFFHLERCAFLIIHNSMLHDLHGSVRLATLAGSLV